MNAVMMKMGRWIGLALLLSISGLAQAALNEARVVSRTPALESMLPPAATLTITTAGSYTLTLSDVQGQSGPGAAFSSLSVVISQGAQLTRLVKLPAGQFTTTSPAFTMAAGQYRVQVLGVTSGASQYGVDLRNSSNVSVFNDVGAIVAPATNAFSSVQQPLTLTVGQSYTVTLSDRVFPVALTFLQSLVTQGSTPVCPPLVATATSATCTFTASTSSHLLTILASEVTNSAGLYSIKVANTATGAVAYEASLPLGKMPAALPVTLPANDAYSLTSIDFLNPAPLSSFKLALVQGANLLVNQATGGAAAFNGIAGAASLYVIPVSATGSAGSYSVLIRRGTGTVFSKVDSVTDTSSTSATGYVFKVMLPAAGNYSLQLRDFSAPQAFASLSASASQDGVLKGTLAAPGPMSINNAVAGELDIAVLANPAAAVAPKLPAGLFGLTLTVSGSSTPLLEKSQGVGGSFSSEVFTALPNARYVLTTTDFAAPVMLDQLLIVVTRGVQQIATVYGGGSLPIDTTPGEYALNFIDTANASPGYGMYGVSFSGVALTSSASSVTAGGSVTLTWNADASGCVASGGWTGNRAISGSSSVTVNADTTFTLTCDGATRSVTVAAVAAPAPATRSSGGGAMSLGWLLLALAGLSARHLRRGD